MAILTMAILTTAILTTAHLVHGAPRLEASVRSARGWRGRGARRRGAAVAPGCGLELAAVAPRVLVFVLGLGGVQHGEGGLAGSAGPWPGVLMLQRQTDIW
eukprot:scaffold44760_cov44-Phaeocystis_antarctica.AAC.2